MEFLTNGAKRCGGDGGEGELRVWYSRRRARMKSRMSSGCRHEAIDTREIDLGGIARWA